MPCFAFRYAFSQSSAYSEVRILCLILPFRRKCRHRRGTARERNRMTGRMMHNGAREKV